MLAKGSRNRACVFFFFFFRSSALPSQEHVLESVGVPRKERDRGDSWGEGRSHLSRLGRASLPVVMVPIERTHMASPIPGFEGLGDTCHFTPVAHS